MSGTIGNVAAWMETPMDGEESAIDKAADVVPAEAVAVTAPTVDEAVVEPAALARTIAEQDAERVLPVFLTSDATTTETEMDTVPAASAQDEEEVAADDVRASPPPMVVVPPSVSTSSTTTSGGRAVFADQVRHRLVDDNPETTFDEIMRLIDDEWSALSVEEKHDYEKQANEPAAADSVGDDDGPSDGVDETVGLASTVGTRRGTSTSCLPREVANLVRNYHPQLGHTTKNRQCVVEQARRGAF